MKCEKCHKNYDVPEGYTLPGGICNACSVVANLPHPDGSRGSMMPAVERAIEAVEKVLNFPTRFHEDDFSGVKKAHEKLLEAKFWLGQGGY